MDILTVIKAEHDKIRRNVSSISESGKFTNEKLLKEFTLELKAHFRLEREYIYPEAQSLFPVNAWVKKSIEDQDTIMSALTSLDKEKKGLINVLNLIVKHLSAEEELLMPKFRSLLSFDQREEFGEALTDYKMDILNEVLAYN